MLPKNRVTKAQKNNKPPTQPLKRSKSGIKSLKKQPEPAPSTADQTSSKLRTSTRPDANKPFKTVPSKPIIHKLTSRNKHVADRRGISEIKRCCLTKHNYYVILFMNVENRFLKLVANVFYNFK